MDDNRPPERVRLAFLSHFVICLACTVAAFFVSINGVPQTIWANDMSMMTSVIGVLFVVTAMWLGWQAWHVDDGCLIGRPDAWMRARKIDADFGHLAERLCVMAGFVGTAIGLSLQARALAGGATSFTALATSLYTTATGGTAAALIAIMTYSLEVGTRSRRPSSGRLRRPPSLARGEEE